MITGWLNLPWYFWAGVALVIAVIYTYIWPRKVITSTTGIRYIIIRWGHAVTWILLSLNFIFRGINPSLDTAANLIALTGGVIYLLFMVMTFVAK